MSLQGNLRPWPWSLGQYIKALVWDFPVMTSLSVNKWYLFNEYLYSRMSSLEHIHFMWCLFATTPVKYLSYKKTNTGKQQISRDHTTGLVSSILLNHWTTMSPRTTTTYLYLEEILANGSRGFIKSGAPGKLSGCEDEFSYQVWPCRGKFSYKKVQFKRFCSHVKSSVPHAETLMIDLP